MVTKQANFLLPEDLLKELREEVPTGKQSQVVAEAIRKELKRLKFQRAITSAFGAWKGHEHPELRDGVERYIRKSRKSRRAKGKG